jgi:O-antigen/teichoic acid export membrane protein
MFSVATGLAFQYMIARSTTTQEYGVWFNINDLLAYFTLLAGILPFWVMRFVARAEKGAVKTGVFANFMISVAAALIYASIVPLMASALGVHEYVYLYLLVSLQIVEAHLNNAFEACLRAKKPQALGYGAFIGEIVKVSLGYLLIFKFQRSLEGAIISIILALGVQIVYYGKLLAEELKQSIRWAYIREWLKGSLVNVYSALGNQIAAFIFIMLFTYGGEAARGNYGAAAQIANIITYSNFLAFALYPKLLAENDSRDIPTSFKTVLMFAIPMTVGVLVMPDLYLAILEEEYMKASQVLIVLAVDAFVATLSTIFSFVLFGLEKIDEEARISLRELFKSRIFMAYSLSYIHSAITIPVTFYVLTTYALDPVQSALSVAIINSSARFAMFLLLYAMVRKMVRIAAPWMNVAKYVFASAIMGCVLYALREMMHPSRVYQILGLTAFGGAFYLMLLTIIDKDTRTLAKLAWQEIMHRRV